MNDSVRCILTLFIIYMPVFVIYGMTYFPNVTRSRFAIVMSSAIGLQLFILAIMFIENLSIPVGLILFILAFPGVYPIAYSYFPRFKERIEKRMSKKL